MKPLLWKEMRDLSTWLLISGALTGAVYFLCLSESFKAFFWSFYWGIVMPLIATLAAVGLGASQVARERHAKTIDYLLARPVARVAVVWSKFIVGSVALLLILDALLWLGYTDPDYHGDEWTAMIRVQVGLWRMLPTLFLRLWCLYALALFFSVLVDRTSKAVVVAAVSAITLLGLIFAYTDIAPFKGFELWLPFFEFTGGLVRVASDASLFWKTSAALATFAMILGLGTLFKRSAHRSLSTKVLALGGVGLIATAILAARLSDGWLAVLHPVADVEVRSQDEGERVVDLAANETLVCLAWEHSLTFVDFADPAKPQTIAKVSIPLWTTSHVVLVGTTAYLVGIRKRFRQMSFNSSSPSQPVVMPLRSRHQSPWGQRTKTPIHFWGPWSGRGSSYISDRATVGSSKCMSLIFLRDRRSASRWWSKQSATIRPIRICMMIGPRIGPRCSVCPSKTRASTLHHRRRLLRWIWGSQKTSHY
jgi:hypothetical protein